MAAGATLTSLLLPGLIVAVDEPLGLGGRGTEPTDRRPGRAAHRDGPRHYPAGHEPAPRLPDGANASSSAHGSAVSPAPDTVTGRVNLLPGLDLDRVFHSAEARPDNTSVVGWHVWRSHRDVEEDAMGAEIDWQPECLDWEPLKAVVGIDGLDEWMWMHACTASETDATVHFYKHVWSRRYVRLDAHGRVYSETPEGEPRLLPSCGGATLLLVLLQACAHVEPGLPSAINLPETAREPCTVEDLHTLERLLVLVSEEYHELAEQLGRRDRCAPH